MVKSVLHPEIDYSEFRGIDDGDVEHSATVYEYETTLGKPVVIALGKANYQYSHKNVIYFSVYLVMNNVPKLRIGVFEQPMDKLTEVMDAEGDVLITKDRLLYFSFATPEIMGKFSSSVIQTDKEVGADISDLPDMNPKEDTDLEETDVLRLKLPTQNLGKTDSAKKESAANPFTEDPTIKQPEMLPEETEAMSNEAKSNYSESATNTWIQKFMKNKEYGLIDNEGGGDCLFAVIRDAYSQIGKVTTVEKLRELLSKEVTDKQFQTYRTLYVNYRNEMQKTEADMKRLQETLTELKRRNAVIKDKEEKKKIKEDANGIVKEFEEAKLALANTRELIQEFQYMENLDTLEKFRGFIQTARFWADTWAISTMERLLNMKIVILSEESQNAGDHDSVLQCGQLNDEVLDKQSNYNPDFYIMTAYDGRHYKLITYKSKNIFKFSEVPYDVKAMVINKCMERNAGPYYLIRDFRALKQKLGLSPDEGHPTTGQEQEGLEHDLYDPETVFMFHAKSDGKPKAGMGSGELLPEARVNEFQVLNKDKNLADWRKKLGDAYPVPFSLDGHRWGSVEQYMLAAPFKKRFTTFFEKFSIDSGSEIATDTALAREVAMGKTNKLKDKSIRPANVTPDVDFVGERVKTARKQALEAKFSQNLDFKKILVETKDAKLNEFHRGMPVTTDVVLMEVRRELSNEINAK
jgi:predicted NAD-dependent protein-ADP-ribosyltransferase YbiA (DUF1768 family)